MTWTDLIHFVTPIALAGATSLASFLFLLPTKIGEKLVGHHFEAKITDLRHEQATELGRLQAGLDHLKDRGIRSNEREYQAISGVWESFVDAFQATRRCVAQFQSFPDLSKLSEDEVTEFLSDGGITGRQATSIIQSKDRNAAYSRTDRLRLIYVAGEDVLKAKALLDKQCVFIPNSLAAQFNQSINMLNELRIEQYMSSRSDIGPLKVDRSIALIGNEGTWLFEHLRDAVRARLLRAMQEDQSLQRQKDGACA